VSKDDLDIDHWCQKVNMTWIMVSKGELNIDCGCQKVN